jgi:hypothetical protein
MGKLRGTWGPDAFGPPLREGMRSRRYAMASTEADPVAAADPRFAGPQVGQRAPEFSIDTASGRLTVEELAARSSALALVSIDSYRYHPG